MAKKEFWACIFVSITLVLFKPILQYPGLEPVLEDLLPKKSSLIVVKWSVRISYIIYYFSFEQDTGNLMVFIILNLLVYFLIGYVARGSLGTMEWKHPTGLFMEIFNIVISEGMDVPMFVALSSVLYRHCG